MTRQSSEGSDVNVPAWNVDVFAARLTEVMERRKISAYAMEKHTGIAQTLVRKYMKGSSIPGADKLVAMAKALNVSVTWLATGQEDQAPLGQPQIDYDKLEEVMIKTLRLFQDRGVKIKPESQARIIRLIYEYVQRQGKEMDAASLNNIIELAAYR